MKAIVSLWQRQRHNRIEAIKGMHLKPSEFCRRWIENPPPGEWGYRAACIRELVRVTGLTKDAINKWGPDLDDCPDIVEILLRKEDIIRQVQHLTHPPPVEE
jgi:hypothetical protein